VTSSPPTRHAYGGDPSQFGELYRPARPTRPGTIVVIHGGFWRARYGAELGRPLAADLANRGYTAWNLEYRRVGNGGGWPNTFEDVAAGIDHLDTLDVDSSAVVTIGHSAGGQLAVWAAGRGALPAGSPGATPQIDVTAAVSQAGVLDLETAARSGVGNGAVVDLLGHPDTEPERYAAADPIRAVPVNRPVLCVHARADDTVPFAQSAAYVATAAAAGGQVQLLEAAGDHFTVIDPASGDWQLVVAALPGLLER
jgi:acetyl esterase/lipase